MINGALLITMQLNEMYLDDNYYGKLIPSKTGRGQYNIYYIVYTCTGENYIQNSIKQN